MKTTTFIVFLTVTLGLISCDSTTPQDQTPREFHVSFDFSGDTTGSFVIKDSNSIGTATITNSWNGNHEIIFATGKLSERWGSEEFYISLSGKGSFKPMQTFTSSDPNSKAHITLAMPGLGLIPHPEEIVSAYQSTSCRVTLTHYSELNGHRSARGNFTATVVNDSGKTLILSNGSFDFP